MVAVVRGFQLWLKNLPLLTALVLTVWLPGNLVLTSLAFGDELQPMTEVRAPLLIEGVFGPIYVAAVIFATDRIWKRQRVTYRQAISFGLRYWGRLFATRFVANLIVMLGMICLLIPGIVIAVRFALIDQAVVLEDRVHRDARARSWQLMAKCWVQVIVISIVFYAGIAFASLAAYLPLDYVFETTAMTLSQYAVADVLISCLLDVLGLPITVIMYFIFIQATGDSAAVPQHTESPEFSSLLDADEPLLDDGNPYGSPTKE